VRYTTIQNWSNNVYNLVTKRAPGEAGRHHGVDRRQHRLQGHDEVPRVYLIGEHAKGETLSVAFAGEGQHQDAGAKMVHAAPNTSSARSSPSRWPAAAAARPTAAWSRSTRARTGRKSTVRCDALLVDTISRSDTYPYVDIREDDVQMGHEATVSKVSEDQLFYLMSPRHDRGRGDGDDRARLRRADRQASCPWSTPSSSTASSSCRWKERSADATSRAHRARGGVAVHPGRPESGCCSRRGDRRAPDLVEHPARRRHAAHGIHRGGPRQRRPGAG
jgi:hypothetical protein